MGPLSDIRILAVEQLMALPFGTQLLADFGATVIGVEAVESRGDAGIAWRDRTGRHKKRIQVKLADPRGQDLLRNMVGRFDVFGENFRPGVLDRYRLGYEDLRVLNDRLVYVSVSGYGHRDILESPLWQMAAYGPIGEAMSGSMHAMRQQGGAASGFALGDITSALFSTIGMLAALHHREKTGRGQYLDVSLADSLFALAELPFVNHSLSLLGRADRPDPSPGYVSAAFRVSDGEVQMNVLSEHHWERLCALLGRPEWTLAPRFVDLAKRREAIRHELLPALEAWASTMGKAEVASACRAVGLAAAPINSPADIVGDAHFVARRMIETVERADGSLLKVAGNPTKLSDIEANREHDAKPPRIARPGEHTWEILHQELGMGCEEYESLRAEGIVGG